MSKWEKQTINLALIGNDGQPYSAPALADCCGGLAIHAVRWDGLDGIEYTWGWTISLVKSGHAFGPTYDSHNNAMRVAETLLATGISFVDKGLRTDFSPEEAGMVVRAIFPGRYAEPKPCES